MVSNGSHCYKPQEGTFNYDALDAVSLRIDYLQSRSAVPGVNMTEYFYHEGTCVHPDITRFGKDIPLGGICPCINVSTGIVAPRWAEGGLYVGRERMTVEYLWKEYTVDHFVKGPHHVWADVATGNIVRLWQPFNGLEVFDPNAYNTTAPPPSTFDMPETCKLASKACIQTGGKKSEDIADQLKGWVKQITQWAKTHNITEL